MKLKNKLQIIAALVAVYILAWGNTAFAHGDIAVIMSRRIPPFTSALEEFRNVVECSCRIYDMSLAKIGNKKVIEKIMSGSRPRLILAVGSGALSFSRKNFPRIPTVFTMVSNPSRLLIKDQDKNITGVRMETPWRVSLAQLKEINPGIKRVGIILNPERVEESVEHIKKAAGEYQIKLIVQKVKNAPQAISEFKNIEGRIEAFLMVADPHIFNMKFYKYILLSSLRHKFILIGLSKKYTRAGSLFSVMGDNRDWGAQAASMVNKILTGTSPGLIPYGFADKYSLSLNLKTAERIGITIPSSVKRKAAHIVE